MRPTRFLVLMFVMLTGCARCAPNPAPIKVDPPKKDEPVPVELYQGLTKDELKRFHHLSMGSELVPLSWLRALENSATNKPFLDDIERFGLLAGAQSEDGLPIGLTAAPSKDMRFAGKMVGFNCAVCHTGELSYKGTLVRIEGAPSLFQVETFTKEMIESLIATFKSPTKLLAFVHRQASDNDHADQRPAGRKLLSLKLHDLEKALTTRIAKLHEAEQAKVDGLLIDLDMQLHSDRAKGKTKLQEGLGKIDVGDVSEIAKDIVLDGAKTIEEKEAAIKETLSHVVETLRLLKARVDFAQKALALQKLKLANTPGGPGRVDDFGAARNLLFDIKYAQPMSAPCSIPPLWGTGKLHWSNWDNSTQSTLERSFATALAGGAVFDPKTYQSTVLLANLGDLELLSAKITPPTWPESVFGTIDRVKVERGAALFKKHCAECHVDANRPADRANDKPWPPDLSFDLKTIGTDPRRVENYAVKLGARAFSEAVQDETAKYVAQAAKDEKVSDADLAKYRAGHANVWRVTNQYAARPLVAVWATAPYLHNGSVPTIYDLLLPADKRPKSFPLGQRDYDPVKLGYVTQVDRPRFTFDVTIPGNSNAGHEYGTTLTDEQRFELIEYLKAN